MALTSIAATGFTQNVFFVCPFYLLKILTLSEKIMLVIISVYSLPTCVLSILVMS